MWIVRLALNRPYTFVVLSLLLFLAGPVMLLRTPVDIFPEINIPVVSIIWTFTGLVPSEMETRITSIYERALTTTVGNIDHIESQSLNGVSVIKVFLQPQANVDGTIAEVNAEAEATLKQLPSGKHDYIKSAELDQRSCDSRDEWRHDYCHRHPERNADVLPFELSVTCQKVCSRDRVF